MAATAQGDEADHAGRLRRGLPRDLGGVALGDFGPLGDFGSRCDFVRNRFGNGPCVTRNRGRSRVLDDGLRADPVPLRQRIDAGSLLDGAEPVLDGQSVRQQRRYCPPLLPDHAAQERDRAKQTQLHHWDSVNQQHGDLPRLNRWTVFRRQADAIHRQHLPMNESSACSSSLVDRLAFRGRGLSTGLAVGSPTAFLLGIFLLQSYLNQPLLKFNIFHVSLDEFDDSE